MKGVRDRAVFHPRNKSLPLEGASLSDCALTIAMTVRHIEVMINFVLEYTAYIRRASI